MAGSRPLTPQRVLQVVLSLQPGGTERLVVELAQRLHPQVATRICCLDEVGSWGSEVEHAGVLVTALGRKPGFRPALGLRIAQVAAEHRATVIHAHHYSPFVYSALARTRRPSLRLLYTEHGRLSDAPPSMKRRLANIVFRHAASRVFAVSEALRAHLIAEGFAPAEVEIVYNGIDVGEPPGQADRELLRTQLGVQADGFVVGTVARLDPVKDLGTLLRAAAQFAPRGDVRFLIIGDGPERRALERQARSVGVAGHVRFLGHRDDARRWLAACDAYVNCSTSEGVSLTILEAMAAGLPVVATRVGGTPEVLDRWSGVLIPPRDPAALAQALAGLAGNTSQRSSLGAAGRRRVSAFFTIERMVNRYRDLYLGAT